MHTYLDAHNPPQNKLECLLTKKKLKLSGYCDKSLTGKHGWNDRSLRSKSKCRPSGIEHS